VDRELLRRDSADGRVELRSDRVALVEEDALSSKVGRVVNLDSDAHVLRRADVAPAEDREALALELVAELVFHRVAGRVELRPGREETRELEREDVGDAPPREADRRDGGCIELTRADL